MKQAEFYNNSQDFWPLMYTDMTCKYDEISVIFRVC